ncbi:sugar phosphate isomerase/epimerase family protein [Flavobacterium geliluteum]|uniref:Sugar phosphate isomerase/epimerase n=1 Tax=Flavobacterium geliluteum TaxID=2816120 RepID=A0A940X959_9FLAO|nr:sugar phosphate isomerase/epimerase [Flavobacterium geliluteum]MBP4137526.1 sugar phosphate isomerase/epimerase [Flavobacterium geliluteum]
MVTRRTFIINNSLAATAVLIAPSLAFTMDKKEIGLQLYTLRKELSNNAKGTLEKVAKAGYTNVETYGFSIKDQFWGLSPIALKQILDSNGLKSVSGHYNLGSFLVDGNKTELKAAIEAAKILKSEYLTIPWVDEPYRKNTDDYKKISAALNEAGKMCQNEGLKLAYHNHDFEFENHNGTSGYQILIQETDKQLVYFEMDLYWVVFSGLNPVDLFQQNPGRFSMWHVKDMDKVNRKLNTEIGSGSIDFKSIFMEAKQSGMHHFFVEQENNYNPNPFDSIIKSHDFISKKLI